MYKRSTKNVSERGMITRVKSITDEGVFWNGKPFERVLIAVHGADDSWTDFKLIDSVFR